MIPKANKPKKWGVCSLFVLMCDGCCLRVNLVNRKAIRAGLPQRWIQGYNTKNITSQNAQDTVVVQRMGMHGLTDAPTNGPTFSRFSAPTPNILRRFLWSSVGSSK